VRRAAARGAVPRRRGPRPRRRHLRRRRGAAPAAPAAWGPPGPPRPAPRPHPRAPRPHAQGRGGDGAPPSADGDSGPSLQVAPQRRVVAPWLDERWKGSVQAPPLAPMVQICQETAAPPAPAPPRHPPLLSPLPLVCRRYHWGRQGGAWVWPRGWRSSARSGPRPPQPSPSPMSSWPLASCPVPHPHNGEWRDEELYWAGWFDPSGTIITRTQSTESVWGGGKHLGDVASADERERGPGTNGVYRAMPAGGGPRGVPGGGPRCGARAGGRGTWDPAQTIGVSRNTYTNIQCFFPLFAVPESRPPPPVREAGTTTNGFTPASARPF